MDEPTQPAPSTEPTASTTPSPPTEDAPAPTTPEEPTATDPPLIEAPTPVPTEAPTATATPTPPIEPAPEAPPVDQGSTEPAAAADPAGGKGSSPAPLLGTGDDAPAAGDRITYRVCTADRAVCTNGTVTVTFAPTVLQSKPTTATVIEAGQHVELDARSVLENPTAADLDAVTADAARGHVHARGSVIDYTGPTSSGADSIRVNICSLGDSSACITPVITVSVAPTFTVNDSTAAAVTTDHNGVATLTIPTRSDSGELDPSTLTILEQPEHATVTATGHHFTLRLDDPAFVGGINFTWRACAAANGANCHSSSMHLSVNDGFGWTTTERQVVAGLSDTLDAVTIAADPTRWGLNRNSVTVTGPDGITIRPASAAGTFRIETPASRHDPFILSICGQGRNHVELCGKVRYLVSALTVTPKQPELQSYDRRTSEEARTAQTLRVSTPASAPAPAPRPARTATAKGDGGVDVTWWVIGAAMLFGLGGGAGALRNRH
ncbi:hypothetical protein [Curtobacterium sp. MCSS17_016]|uniref:hypothetical protein n=1 Tax=Curtobacterium sp. MCSS17_016 TaxID=2175644 RepID=UPI0024E0021B|nr:hypothetical protein [Curtobacterium sp. MCSS17_016]